MRKHCAISDKFTHLCCWHVINKAIWQNLEVRNLEILRNILFWFFFHVQIWDSQEGRDSCLKINKYYVIFRDFEIEIAFLMTCQQHKWVNLSDIVFMFCWLASDPFLQAIIWLDMNKLHFFNNVTLNQFRIKQSINFLHFFVYSRLLVWIVFWCFPPCLTACHDILQKKIHSLNCCRRWFGPFPGHSLHIFCQPILPTFLQLRDCDRYVHSFSLIISPKVQIVS